MDSPVSFVIAAVIGYLLGGIPSGYLVARFIAGQDVRSQGSGKTGATNVRRLLGWKGFFGVLALDAAKAAVAVLIAGQLLDGPDAWIKTVAGLAAVIGHSWSPYLGLQGGRGVAPGGGAMLAMMPEVILLSTLVGIPTVLLSRFVSLGSVAGAIAVPLLTLGIVVLFDRPWPYFFYSVLAAGLILVKHKDNIERLMTGTERRI